MENLQTLRENRDWINLAIEYYNLGVKSMECGDNIKATLWLNRSNAIYSAKDDIYSAVGDDLQDDCSYKIGELEAEDNIYNNFPEYTQEKLSELSSAQVSIIGLFSIARLIPVLNKLSKLTGCELLSEVEKVPAIVLNSFSSGISGEDFQFMSDLAGELYSFADSEYYWGNTQTIPGANTQQFEVFDLHGMMGAIQEIITYLLDFTDTLSALSQGEAPPASECGIVNCTLLADYYARTTSISIEEIPQVKAEISRINDDFSFITSNVSFDDITNRVNYYKTLDILKV